MLWVCEPVFGNIAYKAQLMLAYYRGHYEGAERLERITSWVEVENGHITVRLRNGDQFRDYGARITYPPGEIKPSMDREIVLLAKEKGWSVSEVTGFQAIKNDIALHEHPITLSHNTSFCIKK